MDRFKPPLRVLFAGTPAFALPPLQALIDDGNTIVAVLTQPDRPAGRGKHMRASPVKNLALEHGLEVLQPVKLGDSAWRSRLAELEPDLMVVVAYGLMIPDWLLAMPRLGCWNIHASLLPRWRGAAPIHRAIEAGDAETGVCIMQIETRLDAGPVYHCLSTPIGPQDTAKSLHDRLADMGAEALTSCIEMALKGELPRPAPQDDVLATYARKLSKAEAELDWTESAVILERKVRAFDPWPVAWCELRGQRVRIWRAEVVENEVSGHPGRVMVEHHSLVIGTADRSLKILELQRAGGQRMTAREYLNAHQDGNW